MAHHHDDRTSYYQEQLCTIGICGALVVVCILLWWRRNYAPPPAPRQPMLDVMLSPRFHWPVLAGGLALLVLVVIRALDVARTVPRGTVGHAHDHEDHAHDSCHDHGHCNEHEHARALTAEPTGMPHETAAHVHEHPHEETAVAASHHAHEQADHGHDHGWSPWRYMVLMLPVVLFFLGLPNKLPREDAVNPMDLGQDTTGQHGPLFGMQLVEEKPAGQLQVARLMKGSSPLQAGIQAGDVIREIRRESDADGKPLPQPEVISTRGVSLDEADRIFQDPKLDQVKLVVERAGASQPLEFEISRKGVLDLDFKELENAAYSKEQRDWYEGRTGRLKGQFAPSENERIFTLVRFRMTCCAADAVPLKAMIVAPDNVTRVKPQDWVEVEGKIQFRQHRDGKEYVPVLLVPSEDRIRKIAPEANPYLQ